MTNQTKRIYVSGCGGLIGSSVAELALSRGYQVVGSESDARGRWFPNGGSVAWRVAELEAKGIDVHRKDFRSCISLVDTADIVVHCASQPSHDLSKEQPVEDYELSVMGTLVLLERLRLHNPTASFIFLSTNKVYGDRVNTLGYQKVGQRWEPDTFSGPGWRYLEGISETFPVDGSLHTPFGASKLAADILVQEYARTYGLKTTSLRCGCLTGPAGSAVELHGFMGYLVKCAVTGTPYTIYGYEGLQVRDNLASTDVATAVMLCGETPKDLVYNLGGGRENSISILEALRYLEMKGYRMPTSFGPERLGDHRWWVSDCTKFQRDYPDWKRTMSIYDTIDSLIQKVAA